MDRETQTVRLMIELYCKHHHGSKMICDRCKDLADYAAKQIEKCPFGPDKPVCANCTVHCYKPDMRTQIREVMRFSGPRMTFHHPLLAFEHLRRKAHRR